MNPERRRASALVRGVTDELALAGGDCGP